MRKFAFNWDLIGDIEEGRAHLGAQIDLDMYRLMQFTLRDVLEQQYGAEVAERLFVEAGKLAGRAFFERFIAPVETLSEFVAKVQQVLRDKKIGILRMEKEDAAGGSVVLTVDEDMDCSGLPMLDYETCVYDEGFISALFECFTNQQWNAKEIDCWCTGARTCRFEVTRQHTTP